MTKLIKEDGWYLVKKGPATIPGKAGDEPAPGN